MNWYKIQKIAADFINPFPGLTPEKKINERELSRSIRLSIAAEEEAVHLYEAISDATDNENAKKILQDVANEEKVHIGEFQKLLETIDSSEEDFIEEGKNEIEEIL